MEHLLWNRRRSRRAVADASAKGCSSAASPPPAGRLRARSLEDLLKRQQVVELRLGWHDAVPAIDFTNRRQVRRLVRAVRCNSSILHVRIGCTIRSRKVVSDLLQALNCSGCRSVQTFQLVLHPEVQWVPEEVLKSFLVKQTYLERIELHGVQAVVLGKKSPDGINKARGPPPLPLSSHGQESPPSSLLTRRSWIARGSVVSRVIVHLHRHERLRTLELVDCGVTDGQANLLADFLHVKAGVRLSRLSLRLNKTLGWEGLRDLCQAPVMDQLDLSLCDLHAVEAQSIAASIAKRPWPLRELTLSGNSHIETSGWIALTSRECCNMLTNIDLSYCVVSCAEMVSILDSLRQNLSPTAALREINMQGCARWHQDDEGDSGLSESLCRLLRQGNSLRVVRLNDPRPGRRREDSRNWSNKELSRVLEALRHNYEIELLLYDSWRTKWVGDESSRAANIRNDMDFVLRLNQAGRRILLDRPGQP